MHALPEDDIHSAGLIIVALCLLCLFYYPWTIRMYSWEMGCNIYFIDSIKSSVRKYIFL